MFSRKFIISLLLFAFLAFMSSTAFGAFVVENFNDLTPFNSIDYFEVRDGDGDAWDVAKKNGDDVLEHAIAGDFESGKSYPYTLFLEPGIGILLRVDTNDGNTTDKRFSFPGVTGFQDLYIATKAIGSSYSSVVVEQFGLEPLSASNSISGYHISGEIFTGIVEGDPRQQLLSGSFIFSDSTSNDDIGLYVTALNPVPIPGAALLFASSLLGIIGIRRKLKK